MSVNVYLLVLNIVVLLLYKFSSDIEDDVTCSKTEDSTVQSESSMLYTDLINDLVKPHPNPKFGHFESLANTLYCNDCRGILQPNIANRILCKVPELIVRDDGTVICVHAKCEKLDLNKYVRSVAAECQSWKKTYWRAWSKCHFLSCVTCKFQYPVRKSTMCRYHPERPEYFPIVNLDLEQPIGRYPCCGDRAFRYESIKNPFGCKFRMHVPDIQNANVIRIQKMMEKYKTFTIAEPSPILNYEKTIMKLVNSNPGIIKNNRHWWTKLTLGENQPFVSSILNLSNSEKKYKKSKNNKKKKTTTLELYKNSLPTKSKSFVTNSKKFKEKCSSPVSTKDESEIGRHSPKMPLIMSIQDMQRENESLIFDHIFTENQETQSMKQGSSLEALDQHQESYHALYNNMLAKIITSQGNAKKSTKTKKTWKY